MIDENATVKDYRTVIYNKTEIEQKFSDEQSRVDSELAKKVDVIEVGTAGGLAQLNIDGNIPLEQLKISTAAESLDENNSTSIMTPERTNYLIGIKSIAKSSIGVPLGVAPLDLNGSINPSYLPATRTVKTYVVTTLQDMYDLTLTNSIAEGDRAVVTNEPTDAGGDKNGEYIAEADTPSSAEWNHIPTTNAVSSVNGQVGIVEITSISESASNASRITTLETKQIDDSFDIASLDTRLTTAEAGLLLKANESYVDSAISTLGEDVTQNTNDITSLTSELDYANTNIGLNASAIADILTKITSYASLTGLSSPQYSLTPLPTQITGYLAKVSNGYVTADIGGTISVSTSGIYQVTYTGDVSFLSVNSTRVIELELYDGTSVVADSVINIPRDASRDSETLSMMMPLESGKDYSIRISSNTNMDITFNAINLSFKYVG